MFDANLKPEHLLQMKIKRDLAPTILHRFGVSNRMIYHIDNGRDSETARQLTLRLGVSPGKEDLKLEVTRGPFADANFELKTEAGTFSVEQAKWHLYSQGASRASMVIATADSWSRKVTEYLSLPWDKIFERQPVRSWKLGRMFARNYLRKIEEDEQTGSKTNHVREMIHASSAWCMPINVSKLFGLYSTMKPVTMRALVKELSSRQALVYGDKKGIDIIKEKLISEEERRVVETRLFWSKIDRVKGVVFLNDFDRNEYYEKVDAYYGTMPWYTDDKEITEESIERDDNQEIVIPREEMLKHGGAKDELPRREP